MRKYIIRALCFFIVAARAQNSTAKSVYINLYKRNGAVYETIPLTIKILPKTQECWYELCLGIYKFKMELDGEVDKKITFREGEMKLMACENAVKEIKQE